MYGIKLGRKDLRQMLDQVSMLQIGYLELGTRNLLNATWNQECRDRNRVLIFVKPGARNQQNPFLSFLSLINFGMRRRMMFIVPQVQNGPICPLSVSKQKFKIKEKFSKFGVTNFVKERTTKICFTLKQRKPTRAEGRQTSCRATSSLVCVISKIIKRRGAWVKV